MNVHFHVSKGLQKILPHSNIGFHSVQNRAVPLSPTEWQAMLRDAQPSAISGDEKRAHPIVMDVRNDYEWDSGHFTAAERPLEVSFYWALDAAV